MRLGRLRIGVGGNGSPEGSQGTLVAAGEGAGEPATRNAVRTQPHMPGREGRYAI
jgi:hypothetical protein